MQVRVPRRVLFGLAILGGLALMVAAFASWSVLRAPDESEATGLYAGSLGARVLVIAPHPDDEVIAPGGLTATAIASGATVRTVVVTDGDGFKKAARLISGGPLSPKVFRELGTLRFPETQASFEALGVPPGDRVYLGYGDASVPALWDEGWDRDVVARNGCTSTPYPFAFTAGAPYRGASLAADLGRILEEYAPTSVVYPDPDDNHPDHWSTAAFVEYVLESRGYEGDRYTYLAHFGHYPFPWAYLPNAYMRPPADLVDQGTEWHSLALTEAARETKARALSQHRSQLRIPHMYVYLRSFLRRNELFGTYAPARSRPRSRARARRRRPTRTTTTSSCAIRGPARSRRPCAVLPPSAASGSRADRSASGWESRSTGARDPRTTADSTCACSAEKDRGGSM
jgi:LmbE family N-acetylglucosaminyl deacetylase